jgi:hypothetical protein
MKELKFKPVPAKKIFGQVYCLFCTHAVDAQLALNGRRLAAKPGQRCPRCQSSLDACMALSVSKAA